MLLVSRLIQVSFSNHTILYWRRGSRTFILQCQWWQRLVWPTITIWSTKWSKLFEPMMENLDNTFPNVHSSNKHYERQAKEGVPTILGRRSNVRNIQNIAWNWGRLHYSTSQTRQVFFSQEECWLPSISISSSNPAARWSHGSICHEVAKISSDLWIWWCGKRNKVSSHSELPLRTIEVICITRRHTYPWQFDGEGMQFRG